MAITPGSLIGRMLRQRRRRFAGDQRGTTLIEFALLAVPFFIIVGAILETSVVFLAGQIFESAVQDASRLIRTGQAQGTIVTVVDFRKRVCDRLLGMFSDCSGIFVDVRTITNFSAASITAPVDWTCKTSCTWNRSEIYTAGSGSSIMLVQVYYKWPVMLQFGNLTLANLPGGQRLLGASTVFRNEPFT